MRAAVRQEAVVREAVMREVVTVVWADVIRATEDINKRQEAIIRATEDSNTRHEAIIRESLMMQEAGSKTRRCEEINNGHMAGVVLVAFMRTVVYGVAFI